MVIGDESLFKGVRFFRQTHPFFFDEDICDILHRRFKPAIFLIFRFLFQIDDESWERAARHRFFERLEIGKKDIRIGGEARIGLAGS